jgi:hypothetical protein
MMVRGSEHVLANTSHILDGFPDFFELGVEVMHGTSADAGRQVLANSLVRVDRQARHEQGRRWTISPFVLGFAACLPPSCELSCSLLVGRGLLLCHCRSRLLVLLR